MNEALQAYRQEIERLRSKARHDEAQALRNARKLERQLADKEWQGVVAEVTAEKDAIIAQLQAQLGKQ